MAKKPKVASNTIALNKRARHEYFIEEEIEAGLELQGWEVKSLRAGKANIGDSYVTFRNWGDHHPIKRGIYPYRGRSNSHS